MSKSPGGQGTITALLKSLGTQQPAEDRKAIENQLMEIVYPALRQKVRLALRRENKRHAPRPTELINELYIELFHKVETTWEDRRHFFNMASKKIRDLLAAQARERSAKKRGGGAECVQFTTADMQVLPEFDKEGVTLILEGVLEKLQPGNPPDLVAVSVGEHHFYSGFTLAETAELLNVSLSTIEKKKKKIKDLIMEEWVKGGLGNG